MQLTVLHDEAAVAQRAAEFATEIEQTAPRIAGETGPKPAGASAWLNFSYILCAPGRISHRAKETPNPVLSGLAQNACDKSGEGGIRTPGTVAGTLVFETSTIGHSVTSPAILGHR